MSTPSSLAHRETNYSAEKIEYLNAESATGLHDTGLSVDAAVDYSSRTRKQNSATIVACPGKPPDPARPRRHPQTNPPSRPRPDNLPSRLGDQEMTTTMRKMMTVRPSLARHRPRPRPHSEPAETTPSTRPLSDRSSRPSCQRWVGPPPARPTPLLARGRNATALLECFGVSGRANGRAGLGSAAAANHPQCRGGRRPLRPRRRCGTLISHRLRHRGAQLFRLDDGNDEGDDELAEAGAAGEDAVELPARFSLDKAPPPPQPQP